MNHEEMTLFTTAQDPPSPALVLPKARSHPWWRRYCAVGGDWCDYCVMVESDRAPGEVRTPMRRPTWLRTARDHSRLLLCDGHADLLMAARRERREQ